ncbi:sulfite exporter TauE/SafE family protein [Pleionea sp. CnH1-48]|uniref:sulfite exporter TauE/SafE family protein n=1 Tax=Pleionea sp. CnH1-48 TaxID=2954494 RepID=UPI0020974D39|nr:sulfite exporter TauE/SafE family protein [Pleionea sp. CnH1-48]MCO7225142.1 sulfite exporter TauE/SafE family protein [Pleionea sp. CnH1-48]
MFEWILYLIAGAVAGISAGLLGIGGGFIIVPVLLFMLPQSGVPAEMVMHVAVGTSLATICITSISSLTAHHRRGSVAWHWVRQLTPGIVVGAALAGVIADQLPSRVLAILFGLGGIAMSIQIWRDKQSAKGHGQPSKWQTSLVATGFGCLSGLVGIGGGSLVVPYLNYLGEKITHCVGTAAACGLPIALAGALSYMVVGWNENLPQWSLGYIYVPAFSGIIVASSLTAPLGARLAHYLPAKQLKRVFAVFLAVVGARIIYQSI